MESLEPIQENAENRIEKNLTPAEKTKNLFNDIVFY